MPAPTFSFTNGQTRAAGIGYFLRDNLTDPNFMPTLGQRDSEQRINELAAQLIEKHP
jgi:hypothetical protein